jgi:beta-lactamase class A
MSLKTTGILTLALFALIVSGTAQSRSRQSIPLRPENHHFYPLRDRVDPVLEKALLRQLNRNPRWRDLIAQKHMSVGLVDLSNPHQVRFARINGNEMMYAASLPKIAILLASMDALEKGELHDTPEIRRDLRIMISKSDNQASTRMIDRLGYEKIAAVLTDPRYELYDEEYGGGLWVGKRYAASGARYPDPIQGLSHAATASQVCRFYYLLVNGRLVSYQRSKEMLDLMGNPELHHKFVNTLDRLHPEARLYRKSGSWREFHSDSILVWGPKNRYILVGLLQDAEGEVILRQLVQEVETVLRQSPAGLSR